MFVTIINHFYFRKQSLFGKHEKEDKMLKRGADLKLFFVTGRCGFKGIIKS